MKKSLIALAVLGFAGTAMAQSSVTLYGVADVGIANGKTTYLAEDANGDIVAVTKKTTRMSSAGGMNNGNSRLGVRGIEDLGGGLKVGFNFEAGLNLKDGSDDFDASVQGLAGNLVSGSTAGVGYPNGFWHRMAILWLEGNWGKFKMGRTLTPSFYGVAAWELTGAANYSVVANTYAFAGSGSRNSSQFSYTTPNMGGFSAELGYILKADSRRLVDQVIDDAISGTDKRAAKWDLNLIYANGPLAASLAANKATNQKIGYSLGGKYNFGSFIVAASYNDAHKARRGVSIGGTANLGAFALTLDLTRDTKKAVGKKYTNALLEGKYALSKRTFAYAAFLRLDGNNNYGLGLRHNF